MIDGPWKIEMFGDLRARRGDRVHTRFRTQKTGSLLAYLAYFLQRAHPREELIEMLWPDAELALGRPTLSVALSSLRHQLEPPGVPAGSVIVANHSTVCLNVEFVTTDVSYFQSLLRAAESATEPAAKKQRLLDAIELVRGELLPGRYEDWCAVERERLSEQYVQALRSLMTLLVEARDFTGALAFARQAAQINPLREELHRDVMRLCASTGQPAAAIQQYRSLESLLQMQLNMAPSPATRQLAQEIERRLTLSASAGIKKSSEVETSAPYSSIDLAPALPAGVCTLLLLEDCLREGVGATAERRDLAAVRAQIRRLAQQHGGVELRTIADFAAAFGGANDASSAAAAIYRMLRNAGEPEAAPSEQEASLPSVSMKAALHSDEIAPRSQLVPIPEIGDNPVVRHCVKLLQAAPPGQILCSAETAALLRRSLEPGCSLRSHGLYRLRDEAAAEEIFEVRYAGITRSEFRLPEAEPATSGSLPIALTQFFGQTELLDELQQSLELGPSTDDTVPARIITLTGPGGAGKTRLALESARRCLLALRGAVWFIPLADVQNANLIVDAVRTGLRLSPAPGVYPVDQIVDVLSRQPSLLVLDNFEQLVEDGAAKVQDLLERIPTLRCLVTSRRRLDLSGEREHAVPPLSVPNRNDAPERLAQCDSVQLFTDRAQSVKPDFQITALNSPFVADLCARLQGIPLAIELAAARAQSLTPSQMVARLDRPLELLAGSKRDRPHRHQTLRAAFDWSYDLLAPELRGFFASLSIFPHTWDLDAAEAILECPLALDWLAQLRECSLLYAEEDECDVAGMRYRMLETVRAYALDRLDHDERNSLRRRHADYYLTRAQLAGADLTGQGQAIAAALLTSDVDNFRTAIAYFLGVGQADSAGRITVALVKSWERRGLWDTARLLLRQCLDQRQELTDPILHARLLGNAGWFAFLQSDFGEAAEKTRASLALSREVGDRNGESIALNNLALVTQELGDLPEARRLFESSLALARELGDSGKQAARLSNLGLLAAKQQRYSEARASLEEAHRIHLQSDDRYGASASLCNLGDLALRMEDWAECAIVSTAALRLFRLLQDRPGISYALTNLAESSLQLGELTVLRPTVLEGLEIARELRLQGLVPVLIETWARAQFSVRRAAQSAFALRAADYLRSIVPVQPGQDHQTRLSPLRSALESALSTECRKAVEARAASLSKDELVLAVLADMKEPAIEE